MITFGSQLGYMQYPSLLVQALDLDPPSVQKSENYPLEYLDLAQSADIENVLISHPLEQSPTARRMDLIYSFYEATSEFSQQKGRVLETVAANGDLDHVQFLIEDLRIPDGYICNALCFAAENGHLEIVQCLLKHPYITSEDRGRALVAAAENGHLEIVQILLQEVFTDYWNLENASDERRVLSELYLSIHSISSEDKCRALVAASTNGHEEIVQLLQ